MAVDVLGSAGRGDFRARLGDFTTAQVEGVGRHGQQERGRTLLATIIETDLEAGVSQQFTAVVAGTQVTLWECDPISPLWILIHRGGRVDEIRLHHPGA